MDTHERVKLNKYLQKIGYPVYLINEDTAGEGGRIEKHRGVASTLFSAYMDVLHNIINVDSVSFFILV